jgi:hypothetical protein
VQHRRPLFPIVTRIGYGCERVARTARLLDGFLTVPVRQLRWRLSPSAEAQHTKAAISKDAHRNAANWLLGYGLESGF